MLRHFSNPGWVIKSCVCFDDFLAMMLCNEKFGKVYGAKVYGANMGPTRVLSAPRGPHVGPINLVIRVCWLMASNLQNNVVHLAQYNIIGSCADTSRGKYHRSLVYWIILEGLSGNLLSKKQINFNGEWRENMTSWIYYNVDVKSTWYKSGEYCS